MDLTTSPVLAVIWVNGFGRNYPFLSESLLVSLWNPERQILINKGGITPQLGLYVLGYRWMRRKHSNFVDGVREDAAKRARHLVEQESTKHYA